jgi:hypothetical protein
METSCATTKVYNRIEGIFQLTKLNLSPQTMYDAVHCLYDVQFFWVGMPTSSEFKTTRRLADHGRQQMDSCEMKVFLLSTTTFNQPGHKDRSIIS